MKYAVETDVNEKIYTGLQLASNDAKNSDDELENHEDEYEHGME